MNHTLETVIKERDTDIKHLSKTSFINRMVSDRNVLLEHLTQNGIPDILARLCLIKLLNLLVSKYHFTHQNQVMISKPFGLVVDPSNTCHLRCPGCVHVKPMKGLVSWPGGFLSEQMFYRFLREFGPYATHIYFYNQGEPLLNPHTSQFIQMARRYLLTTVISTNLSIENLDTKALVESGLDYLILAIDGASDQTYSTYRRRGNFKLVMQNLEKLVEAKRILGRYAPYLVWQFLVFEHNVHEIPYVKKLAELGGVNELIIAEPFDVDRWDPTIKKAQTVHYERIVFDYDFQKAKQNQDDMIRNIDIEAFKSCFVSFRQA